MKTIPSIYSASVSVAFTAVVTVFSEINEGFKDFLAALTGHHWVTKSILSLLVFFASYFVMEQSAKDDKHMFKATVYLLAVTVLSILVVFLFYVMHYFKLI